MLEEKLAIVFESIEDVRSWRNQKYPFLSLIGIGLLRAIAGIDSFSGLTDYAQAHEENLKKVLSLPTETPSHDTLQRLFDNLNPEQFSEKSRLFTEHLAQAVEGIIAIDGKTIRNSGNKPLIKSDSNGHVLKNHLGIKIKQELNTYFRVTLYSVDKLAVDLATWEKELLEKLILEQQLSTTEIAKIWKVTTRTARTRLKKMVEMGLINRITTLAKNPYAVFKLK